LQAIEPLDDPADRVGTLRCVSAAVHVSLLGARSVRWVEQVTDIATPWTIEYEALARRPIAHWRVRLRLLEQPDAGTRVRCRLTYVPASLGLRLANLLFLRKAITHQAQALLDGLARSFQPALAARPAHEATRQTVADNGNRAGVVVAA